MYLDKKLEYLYLTKKFNIDGIELLMLDIQKSGLKTNIDSTIVKLQMKFEVNGKIYHKPIINNPKSRFEVRENIVWFDNKETNVKIVEMIEDSPRHYYFRGKNVLVINSTFLSPCNQGCKFCEQTNAPIDKRRYSLKLYPKEFFDLVEKNEKMKDLSGLKQISIVTSCAGKEERALELITGYALEARKRNFSGKLLFATNEIRTNDGLKKLAELGDVILAFTVECFSNREKMMPGSKGKISLTEIKNILLAAKKVGIETTYFYIFGLDNLHVMRKGFEYLCDSITIAPTGPNYQPQGKIIPITVPSLQYFLRAREIYQGIHNKMYRLESVQNFRSLWPLEITTERKLVTCEK